MSCCKLSGVRFFVFEDRSWSDNNAPVTLYQMKFTICSEKRGKGPKAQPSPSAVPSGLRGGRSQLVAPSGPGPQTCSAVITKAVRSPTQLALGLFKPPKQRRGGQSCPADCYSGEGQLLLGHRDRDGGGVHSCLKAGAQPVGGFREGSGALRDIASSLFPGSPQLTC